MAARVGPDRLGVAGRLAVDRVERGLRCHVVGRKAGPAGGEDEAHALRVGQTREGGADRVARVGHGLVADLEPGRLAEPHESGT